MKPQVERERVSLQREHNVAANRQLLGRCDLGGPWEVGGKYSAQAPISGASMEGADPLPASVGVSGGGSWRVAVIMDSEVKFSPFAVFLLFGHWVSPHHPGRPPPRS